MRLGSLLIALLILSFLNAGARNLSAFLSVCTFNSPDKGTYLETYLNIVGNSVRLVKDINGKYQGKVEVELTFSQAGEIKYHDKYNLLGSQLEDTTALRPDFIDEQRIPLANGDYDLALKISDKYAPDQSFSAHRPVKIDFPKGILSISDIEMLASYSQSTKEDIFNKSGFTIVPLVSDYYPQELTTLKFYAEIYNTKNVLNDDPFVINYFISGHENKYIPHNLVSFKRETPKDVCIILAELPLKDLASGNYDLTIEVRSKTNALLATKQVFFQRSNVTIEVQTAKDIQAVDVSNTFVTSITNKDTLKDYIESLRPISSRLETEFADNLLARMGGTDVKFMQQYFYDFWARRNGSDPEKEWKNYLVQVRKVNAAFSTSITRGYATDRGRVYLQYGAPNSVFREENEPYAYPYEIWHYYKLGTQSNRRFLFYCHEPASNAYTLLHSDAQGEYYNDRWQTELYSRVVTPGLDPDNPQSPFQGNIPPQSGDVFGKRALEEFYNPK